MIEAPIRHLESTTTYILLQLDCRVHLSYYGRPPTEVTTISPQNLPKSNRELIPTPHRFNQNVLIDTTPMPDSVPKVAEIGASSAPLLSASFFIGARCSAYNDDYMKCKTEAYGKGEIECMKEGRKVTRCAASV